MAGSVHGGGGGGVRSGRYASYWNAFLLTCIIKLINHPHFALTG